MSEFSADDISREIIDSLPAPFLKERDTNNHRTLHPIADGIADIGNDLNRVQIATQIANAETIDELQELANLVDVKHNSGEGLEAFRIRVLVAFNIITSEATIKELIAATVFVLDISPESIEIEENITPGVIQVTIPSAALSDLPLTQNELFSILSGIIAAGRTLEVLLDASLEYVTAQEWHNGRYSPDQGKGGLDSNGERIVRGKYAGLID
jgi:hypothetical protein